MKNNQKKGITLVEILVAITIGTVILISLASIFSISSKSYRYSIREEELTQNARIALERISRDLRQTEKIITLLPSIKTDPLNPAPSQLEFQNGHDRTKINYIRYYLENNNLRRESFHFSFSSDPDTWVAWNSQDQYGNPPTKIIDEESIKADKVDSIIFYGEKAINIEIKVVNESSSFDFKTEVFGRNT